MFVRIQVPSVDTLLDPKTTKVSTVTNRKEDFLHGAAKLSNLYMCHTYKLKYVQHHKEITATYTFPRYAYIMSRTN